MSGFRAANVLLVLDGWGHRDAVEDNAIARAHTPIWDRLWREKPHTLLSGSGMDIGLPAGQMGNSEVGHMTLGAGRIIKQDLTRIDEDITDGGFFSNRTLLDAVAYARQTGGAVHLLGLLSPGGVHSHERHIRAAVELVARQRPESLYLHAFLDGRDTPPRSALPWLQRMDAEFAHRGLGRTASICGRYYALDRDRRWERTADAWRLLVKGAADFDAEDAAEALRQAYARGESDEFVRPVRIHAKGQSCARIRERDAVICMQFRADRALQLCRALTKPAVHGFDGGQVEKPGHFVTLTRYADDMDVPVAYLPVIPSNGIGEYLAGLGKTQLRIAETEKYAHVTFFFNGGRGDAHAGEEHILIPSPRVATYDLAPEMSALAVTDRMLEAIRKGYFDLIVCNFANGDMVGHTGIFDAAVRAVETLDRCLGRILSELENIGGQCLITADHGNVELMYDHASAQPHTAHTTAPVPLVYSGPRDVHFTSGGLLADVAPTMLDLMDLPQPMEMTGRSLCRSLPKWQRA